MSFHESELLGAAIESTQQVEESSKAQIENSRRLEESESDDSLRCETAMKKKLEAAKRESRELKLNIASLSEEKLRAETKANSWRLKHDANLSSVKDLTRVIEEINEEHVLVELARIEAIKEHEQILTRRREETAKYTASIGKIRRKKMERIKEINATKGTQQKLATTLSDISSLENEFREMKEGATAAAVTAAKVELIAAKEEGFHLMASMANMQRELIDVGKEITRAKKKEEKTETMIQNLNTKLVRANLKLDSTAAAARRANSVLSDLFLTLQKLKSGAKLAREETSKASEEAAAIREEIQTSETEIQVNDEILRHALSELKGRQSSEAKALDDLKRVISRTTRHRGSISGENITISKFEYEYLKGSAAEAVAVAEKKVAAARAWTESVKASEREIQLETESIERETGRTRAWKKPEDHKPEELSKTKKELDKWMQKIKPETIKLTAVTSKDASRNIKMNLLSRQGSKRFASHVRHGSKRSKSFTVARRAKVMPNLRKLLSGHGTGRNLQEKD
ncbi:hypothetical protein M569_05499 [Genlisea aurea]|uniref:WEB family protein n=1 Tax=Genlisea aurea TaxID=192259 RepID=S8CR51_9LAMI|nr:hypothetical protein M569_05499 [Genlisea aurea]